MISDDIANLSDRLVGHLMHNTSPSHEEMAAMAAELLKFSGIVRAMETLPLDVTFALLTETPEWPLVRSAVETREPPA